MAHASFKKDQNFCTPYYTESNERYSTVQSRWWDCAMRSCAVISCKNSTKYNNKVAYFCFPLLNSEVINEWIAATGRPAGWTPQKHNCICSEHFNINDSQLNKQRIHLKPGSIPVLKLCGAEDKDVAVDFRTVEVRAAQTGEYLY